jgi:NAD+--asparagine ADP-ribosyltransferase
MERLMRTELARVQTEAQKQSFERNGFSQYEFLVNRGCCPVCAALDGKHFDVGKMMPGTNAPPMHPNCRCSTAAWEDDEEYEAWLDYLDQGGTTEEWNKTGLAEWKKLQKEVENPENGDIIKTEMFKKPVDPRVKKGFRFISDKQFDDMTAEVKKLGAVIERGTPDVVKHLESLGATASNLGKYLLFMEDVCVSEVLEETRHFMQNINRMNDDKPEPLRTYLNEIDAKRYILAYKGSYKVPRNELEEIQKELERYERLLAEYEEGEK